MAKADFKICPHCKESFDIKETPHYHRGNRYWHIDCLKLKYPKDAEILKVVVPEPVIKEEKVVEEKPKDKNMRKCLYCGKYFNITEEKYCMARSNRYAHEQCYKDCHTEDEEYIDNLYGIMTDRHINYNYNMCERQRTSYMKNNGYTNKGMMLALKYFYEIKGGDSARSNGGIGIIPFVYDEAQVYYETLEKTQKRLAKEVKIQMAQERKEIHVRQQQRRGKQYIDLDTLGE